MKVQQTKHKIRIKEWATQIDACKKSGMTVRQWCEEIGINPKTFYNRMRAVREEILDQADMANADWESEDELSRGEESSLDKHGRLSAGSLYERTMKPIFAALPTPKANQPAAVTVRVGGYAVEIQDGASDTVLEKVLRLVARL